MALPLKAGVTAYSDNGRQSEWRSARDPSGALCRESDAECYRTK